MIGSLNVSEFDELFVSELTGRIAEYDSPKRLLEREDYFFSKLIKEYSMRSQNLNTTQQ